MSAYDPKRTSARLKSAAAICWRGNVLKFRRKHAGRSSAATGQNSSVAKMTNESAGFERSDIRRIHWRVPATVAGIQADERHQGHV
jgi:hypothetical protein